MADYTPKDGSGSAFKNTRKDKETQPDWRGDAMIDGKRVSIAIWEKEGTKGMFLSMKFEDYKAPIAKPVEVPAAKTSNDPEDFPF